MRPTSSGCALCIAFRLLLRVRPGDSDSKGLPTPPSLNRSREPPARRRACRRALSCHVGSESVPSRLLRGPASSRHADSRPLMAATGCALQRQLAAANPAISSAAGSRGSVYERCLVAPLPTQRVYDAIRGTLLVPLRWA